MSVKQFFKSAAFKCIIVLFAILIVCGALLTCAYGFLAVSKGERLMRAVGKIYNGGETVKIYGGEDGNMLIDENESNPQSLLSDAIVYDDAEINSAYKIEVTTADGANQTHYLVQSKGMHGFSEGTVTCWVAINVDVQSKTILNIAKVSVGESSAQTFMNKITGEMMTSYTEKLEENGYYITDGYVSTGASLSSTAINNSVNGAIKYVTENVFGKTADDFFATLNYASQIITAKTSATLSGTAVTYTVTTKGRGGAGSFEIEITVDSSATITAFTIKENGSTTKPDYLSKMPASVINGTAFVGKGISYFTSIYGSGMEYAATTETDGVIATGATSNAFASNSVYLCMCAGAFATGNYTAVYNHLSGGAR